MHDLSISVETPIVESPRVLQVRGLFDLPSQRTTRLEWHVVMPLHEKPWNVGLIVGPSGCGKSTIGRRLWPSEMQSLESAVWLEDRSLLDSFPDAMSIKDICALLSSVGLSSPPAWLRPFPVLSTGEKFRVSLARVLAESPALAVVDEFTSVVDRTVAQVGSAALARTVRARQQRFIAITCHEDVEEWLQPDWVYRPAEKLFSWRLLRRRPAIPLTIFRCKAAAWALFHQHHYLSGKLAPGAVCFLATWRDRPVAFSAWVNALTRRGGRREHRTVTLPDFQGVGIGAALSNFCASLWKALGHRVTSTTTHPAFIAARLRGRHWRMIRRPSLAGSGGEKQRPGLHHASTRLTAGFEYVGPALDPATAQRAPAP